MQGPDRLQLSGPIKGAPSVGETEASCATSGSSEFDGCMRPTLEIWIDEFTSPVTIRLAGVLDRTTEIPFLRFIDELLVGGVRHLMIDAGAVEVGDVSGASALAKLQRRTSAQGGSLTWEGVDFNQPRHQMSILPQARSQPKGKKCSDAIPGLGEPFNERYDVTAVQ
jgi:anti-anti-sigma regulatory factor